MRERTSWGIAAQRLNIISPVTARRPETTSQRLLRPRDIGNPSSVPHFRTFGQKDKQNPLQESHLKLLSRCQLLPTFIEFDPLRRGSQNVQKSVGSGVGGPSFYCTRDCADK